MAIALSYGAPQGNLVATVSGNLGKTMAYLIP